MGTKQLFLLYLVAGAMVLTGLYMIVSWWPTFTHPRDVLTTTFSTLGPWQTVLIGLVMLVPLLKLAMAGGLLLRKRWAWFSAVMVLVVEILLHVRALVRLWTFDRDGSQLARILEAGGQVVQVHSAWPTYIITVINILSVLVLMRKQVKSLCVSS